MPKTTPTISWQSLRNYMEQWIWTDPKTGVKVTGFNPPERAKDKTQKPFYFRAITIKGELIAGEAICLKVYLQQHQRMIRFTASNEIRRIRDYLVMEVNGVRVVTH